MVLLLNPVGKFLNHRVGEHVFGNALHLGFGSSFVQAAIQLSSKNLPWRTASTPL